MRKRFIGGHILSTLVRDLSSDSRYHGSQVQSWYRNGSPPTHRQRAVSTHKMPHSTRLLRDPIALSIKMPHYPPQPLCSYLAPLIMTVAPLGSIDRLFQQASFRIWYEGPEQPMQQRIFAA